MKGMHIFLTATLIALTSAFAHAQATKTEGLDKAGASAKSVVTHKTAGVVKKADPAKGTVTLAHEAVKSLNWPAMTMSFTVKDKALFDKLQADKKIEFEFVQQGKDYVIIAVK